MTKRIAFQIKEIEDDVFGDGKLWQIGIVVGNKIANPILSPRQYKLIDRFVFDSFTDWNSYCRENFHGRN